MADGSIRIEATISDEQAKKQLEQMSKDIEKQSAAIDKQTAKVNKLAAQWEKVSAGGTKGLKMKADLAATSKEAERLSGRLEEVNAEIVKAQADYNTKLKQAATGEIPQEEFSESAQKLNNLVAESDKLAEALRNADDKAAMLKQQLAEASEASRMSPEGQNITSSLSNEQAKLETMQAGFAQAKAAMGDFANQTTSKFAKVKRALSELGSGVKTTFGKLKDSIGNALGKAVDKLKAKFSSFGKSSAKSMKKAGNGIRSFGIRLKSIVAGALFFNLISKALTALTNRLGSALLANKTFAKSFGQVKSNLLTAFQPIYEAILPWLNKLMQALAQVTAQMAQFTASVFGTTAQKAQDNAKALEEQVDATNDTTKATKKAEKALASFDTVQKLTNKTEDPSKPKFDTDFSTAENQMPQWLTDFWKTFQESWAQYGQQTIESAKNALSALKDMVSAIGQSFMNVWNNGTGVETLNNLQFLLQTILDLIASIATAFTNAWNTGNVGEQMLQSIMNLINTVVQAVTAIGQAFIAAWNDGNAGERLLSALMQMITAVVNLVNSIGQAFIKAWTDAGLGESIFSHIFSIITNIANAIKSLAENLQSAWEYNGNGVSIWKSILKIIDDVLGGIDKMSQATADWASGLNFEPLVTAFKNFMAALEPVVDLIMNGLAWAWENVLLPLGKWTIEKAAPAVLDLLTAALQAIAKVCEALAPVLQQIWKVVKPIISFIGSTVIGAIKLATQAITVLGDALAYVIGLIGKVGNSIGSGISSLIGAFSGTSTFALNASMPTLNVPALANGAVISPNNQFLALLGDQRSGVNVETPLSTMIDAFNKALDARGGTGNNNAPINLYIDGTKFARITNAYNSNETRRRGVNLVTGGA
jgi:phage-related protein|nr:MAG TPA: minor tail protein [Caudoviricetes sp.]